jgi:hypothetical protein
MQVTLQVVSRLALSNSRHPTYTPTPLFLMRTLPTEIWQSGRLDLRDLAWLLVCLSGEAGRHHAWAAGTRDHGTPRVKSLNSYFSAMQRERGHPMRTQALVLVLIVIAASEPARLFRTIVDGVVALLRCFKLL